MASTAWPTYHTLYTLRGVRGFQRLTKNDSRDLPWVRWMMKRSQDDRHRLSGFQCSRGQRYPMPPSKKYLENTAPVSATRDSLEFVCRIAALYSFCYGFLGCHRTLFCTFVVSHFETHHERCASLRWSPESGAQGSPRHLAVAAVCALCQVVFPGREAMRGSHVMLCAFL